MQTLLFITLATAAILGSSLGATVSTATATTPRSTSEVLTYDELPPGASYTDDKDLLQLDTNVDKDDVFDLEGVDVSELRNSKEPVVVEGIDVNLLSDEVLNEYLTALDDKFTDDVDLWVGKQTILEQTGPRRQKRWIPLAVRGAALAFKVGRRMFNAAKLSKTTTSAGKVTRQYERAGDFRKAVSDLHRLKPTNVRQFTGKNGVKGVTGKMGKYTVQARNKSSDGRPTLEVFKTNKADRTVKRKVRYGKKN